MYSASNFPFVVKIVKHIFVVINSYVSRRILFFHPTPQQDSCVYCCKNGLICLTSNPRWKNKTKANILTLDHLLKSLNCQWVWGDKNGIPCHDLWNYSLLRPQILCYNSGGNVLHEYTRNSSSIKKTQPITQTSNQIVNDTNESYFYLVSWKPCPWQSQIAKRWNQSRERHQLCGQPSSDKRRRQWSPPE